jgi:hypothetical protein
MYPKAIQVPSVAILRGDKGLREKHRSFLEASGARRGEKRSVASMPELKPRVNGVKRPVAPGAKVPQPRSSSHPFIFINLSRVGNPCVHAGEEARPPVDKG